MGRKAKVKEEPFLIKDLDTGAVINTDKNSFLNAVTRKRKMKEFQKEKEKRDAELQSLKDRLDHLESLINKSIS